MRWTGEPAPLSFAMCRAERDVLLGQDPEVRINTPNFYGDPNLSNGYTQESWPQFRRFLATVRFSF